MTLGGSLARDATEATLRAQDTVLTLTLAHDSWAAGSGELANMADATALLILGSAVASTTQDFGWNNVAPRPRRRGRRVAAERRRRRRRRCLSDA